MRERKRKLGAVKKLGRMDALCVKLVLRREEADNNIGDGGGQNREYARIRGGEETKADGQRNNDTNGG